MVVVVAEAEPVLPVHHRAVPARTDARYRVGRVVPDSTAGSGSDSTGVVRTSDRSVPDRRAHSTSRDVTDGAAVVERADRTVSRSSSPPGRPMGAVADSASASGADTGWRPTVVAAPGAAVLVAPSPDRTYGCARMEPGPVALGHRLQRWNENNDPHQLAGTDGRHPDGVGVVVVVVLLVIVVVVTIVAPVPVYPRSYLSAVHHYPYCLRWWMPVVAPVPDGAVASARNAPVLRRSCFPPTIPPPMDRRAGMSSAAADAVISTDQPVDSSLRKRREEKTFSIRSYARLNTLNKARRLHPGLRFPIRQLIKSR